MEIIEMVGWLVLGFVPMFSGLHIMGRKLRSSKPYEKLTTENMSNEVLERGL
jgi:hypothetical protein